MTANSPRRFSSGWSLLLRRALHGEKVVEVSRSVYRADRYTLWVQIGQDF